MANNPFRTLATLSLFLVFGLAHAQQDGDLVEADPPDRAARLSVIRGDVTMRPAGEQDWAPAILNRPLTTGDELWTEPGARAEIQVGRSAVRLSENTGFSFLEVNDDTIQMRMTTGVLTVRVRAIASDEDIEIDTPNLALTLLEPGSYRVEVNEEGDTTVVKVDDDGEAEVHGPARDTVVHSGQAATFRGFDHIDADVARLGARDEFDSWSRERDEQYDRVASSRTAEYVSPDVTGYEDLDQHGSWSSEPEYGYVWTPRYLGADWSPYRFGRWVWVSPWGWTWIDDAPWGYAPFHYGRWAHVRNRWCWVPGPRHARAVYAPALVGWVDGAHGTVVRGGRVGWFPLGPREVYVPARRYSHRYFERVNTSNTIIQRALLANAEARRRQNVDYRNRGAVTVVDRGTFTSAGRVGDRRVRVDDGEMARSRATAQAPQVDPVRASRLGEVVRTNQRRPPQGVAERRVVVRRNPPEAERQLARAQVERRAPRPENRDRPRDDDGNRNRERNVQAAPATTRELQPRADRPTREQIEQREQQRREQNQNREQQTREVQARREAEVRQEQQQRGDERRRQFEQQQAQDEQLREQSARARQERDQQRERLDRRDVQRQQQDQERERRVQETRERRDAQQVEQLRQRQDDQQREARDQQRQQQERQQESRRQLYEQQREVRDQQRQQHQQQPPEQRQQQQERRPPAERQVERTRTEQPRQERTERPAQSQKPVEARPPPRERAENRARERKN